MRCTPISPAPPAAELASCWVLGGIHGETLAAGPGRYDTAKADGGGVGRRGRTGRDDPPLRLVN